jgi:fructose/tagatose bisphosphate aldolase
MVAGGTLFFKTIESIKEKRPEATALFNQMFHGASGRFAEEIEDIILQGIKKEGISHVQHPTKN